MLNKVRIYLYAIKYYLFDMVPWDDAIYVATAIVTGWNKQGDSK